MGADRPTTSTSNSTVSIRLVATDLDGTLLLPGTTISERTRNVLQRVQQQGVTVVLVSARPPCIVENIARSAGVGGLAICCNGAIVYDLEQGAIIQHAPLSPELALQLIHVLRQTIPDLTFACECGLNFKYEPAFAQLRANQMRARPISTLCDILTLCDEPITKLLVLHPTCSVEELDRLTSHLTRDNFLVTHSGAPYLEISAPGVHKAWALAALCEQLHISANEVIAFGDMPNDLSMLNWAGHGVAVANAHPLVLAGADEITLANTEDGVALVLERLLLQQ